MPPGPLVPDHPDGRKTSHYRLQYVPASVDAPIVHANDLEAAVSQGFVHRHHEWLDVVALVSDRDDDGNHA